MHQLKLLWHAYRAFWYAQNKGTPGIEFARFGRWVGWQMLRKRKPAVGEYLLAPVQSTRHFEFPFVWSCIPPGAGDFLDVSSPRLFSLYTATHRPDTRVKVINPDADDIRLTSTIADALKLVNLKTAVQSVEELRNEKSRYDCIWSISVLEHIWTDTYDDRDAVQWMYNCLKPGGRLILTVPTDRTYWLEYRENDAYGLQTSTDQGYFFQRFYDAASIQSRLIDMIGQTPARIEWYGERVAGRFHAYVEAWRKAGRSWLVNDPREMTDHYTTYARWEDMPGVGVCGIMFVKPLD